VFGFHLPQLQGENPKAPYWEGRGKGTAEDLVNGTKRYILMNGIPENQKGLSALEFEVKRECPFKRTGRLRVEVLALWDLRGKNAFRISKVGGKCWLGGWRQRWKKTCLGNETDFEGKREVSVRA